MKRNNSTATSCSKGLHSQKAGTTEAMTAAAPLARQKAQDEQSWALKQLVKFWSYPSQWQISKWSLHFMLDGTEVLHINNWS